MSSRLGAKEIQLSNFRLAERIAQISSPLTEVTIPIASGIKDGYISRNGVPNVWPPIANTDVNISLDTNNAIMVRKVRHEQFGFSEASIGCLIFDTLSIPDEATIISATLRAVVGDRIAAGGLAKNLELGWYDYGAAIGFEDWVLDLPSVSAADVPFTTWSAWSIGALCDITLLNPDANINKNGETGLRMVFSAGDPGVVFPSRDNVVSFYSLENASFDEPKLIITYTVSQKLRPDADLATSGWTTAPLWSKIDEDSADGTVITGVAS